MIYPRYASKTYESRDTKYNYINTSYMIINLFQLLFLRVLLSPWRENMQKQNDKKTKKLFCCLVIGIITMISFMFVGNIAYILYFYKEIDLFGQGIDKTILLFWVEV